MTSGQHCTVSGASVSLLRRPRGSGRRLRGGLHGLAAAPGAAAGRAGGRAGGGRGAGGPLLLQDQQDRSRHQQQSAENINMYS